MPRIYININERASYLLDWVNYTHVSLMCITSPCAFTKDY